MKKDKSYPGWPYFGRDEISAVTRVLRSGKVNQWTGKEVFSFEKEYAGYLGVKYAVALANGSVALDISLLTLGIGPGDQVIVPARSFVATASCVALKKAEPVFADVDPQSQNVTVQSIERVLTKKTKAVIAVHLAGWPCELDLLRGFCDKKGIYLIEDCAQAHGAKYKGKPIGSFGDIACFSFCQDKIITTGGEGGLLVTNNAKVWKKAWSYKDHGRDYRTMFRKKDSCGFVWSVKDFGSNYRMTEMQAAIGRLMLLKLDAWVTKRRSLAAILSLNLEKFCQLRVAMPPVSAYHSYYKYYVFVKPRELKKGQNRDKIIAELNKSGIPCGTGVCPEIYLERGFSRYASGWRNYSRRRLPIARQLGATSMMFQVHPRLSRDQMYRIVEKIGQILKR